MTSVNYAFNGDGLPLLPLPNSPTMLIPGFMGLVPLMPGRPFGGRGFGVPKADSAMLNDALRPITGSPKSSVWSAIRDNLRELVGQFLKPHGELLSSRPIRVTSEDDRLCISDRVKLVKEDELHNDLRYTKVTHDAISPRFLSAATMPLRV